MGDLHCPSHEAAPFTLCRFPFGAPSSAQQGLAGDGDALQNHRASCPLGFVVAGWVSSTSTF